MSLTSTSDVPTALRASLRLPSLHRWVADFLFSSLPYTPFHPSHTLPPPSLLPSLALNARHMIAFPPPVLPPDDPRNLAQASLRALCREKSVDMLFVPCTEHDHVVVGYCRGQPDHHPRHHHDGTDTDDDDDLDCDLDSANPFAPPFIARFAYGGGMGGDLLIVTHAPAAPIIGLISMGVSVGGCRDQRTILVPSGDYAFGRLPCVALGMYRNIEVRQRGAISPTSSPPPSPPPPECDAGALLASLLATGDDDVDDDLPPLPPLDAATLHTASPPHVPSPSQHATDEASLTTFSLREPPFDPTPVSYMPWTSSMDAAISAGATLHASSSPLSSSSSPPPLSLLSSSLSALSAGDATLARTCPIERAVHLLGRALKGRFFGATVRADTLHATSGRYVSALTGRIEYEVRTVEPRTVRVLRRAFAHAYYLAVLCVAPDARLVKQAHVGSGGEWGREGRGEAGMGAVGAVGAAGAVETWVRRVGVDEGAVSGEMETETGMGWVDGSVRSGSKGRASGTGVVMGRQGRERALVPRVQTQADAVVEGESAEMSKERVAVARRQRNRLSAARSNAQKRERTASMQGEIERNRQRIRELVERERGVRKENEWLRGMCQSEAEVDVGRDGG